MSTTSAQDIHTSLYLTSSQSSPLSGRLPTYSPETQPPRISSPLSTLRSTRNSPTSSPRAPPAETSRKLATMPQIPTVGGLGGNVPLQRPTLASQPIGHTPQSQTLGALASTTDQTAVTMLCTTSWLSRNRRLQCEYRGDRVPTTS